MHFCNFRKKYFGNFRTKLFGNFFENSPASWGHRPPYPPQGRPLPWNPDIFSCVRHWVLSKENFNVHNLWWLFYEFLGDIIGKLDQISNLCISKGHGFEGADEVFRIFAGSLCLLNFSSFASKGKRLPWVTMPTEQLLLHEQCNYRPRP